MKVNLLSLCTFAVFMNLYLLGSVPGAEGEGHLSRAKRHLSKHLKNRDREILHQNGPGSSSSSSSFSGADSYGEKSITNTKTHSTGTGTANADAAAETNSNGFQGHGELLGRPAKLHSYGDYHNPYGGGNQFENYGGQGGHGNYGQFGGSDHFDRHRGFDGPGNFGRQREFGHQGGNVYRENCADI